MDVVEKELRERHDMCPISWNCLIPPVHAWILDKIDDGIPGNRTLGEWCDDFTKINELINDIWEPFVVDLYHPFLNPRENTPAWWALKDIVHFSEFSVGLIQDALEIII